MESSKEELLAKAKRDYPPGTQFRCANGNTPAGSINGIFTVSTYRYMGAPQNGVHSGNGWIYLYGKWATIISTPETKLTFNYLIL